MNDTGPRHSAAAPGKKNIDPDRYPSIVAMAEEAMARFTSLPAFRSFDQVLTYGEVERLSRNLAAFLQKRVGVVKGERVAMMCPNILAFPVGTFGILRAGAIQVNVNPQYTARELAYQLNDADARTIVIFADALPTLLEVLDTTRIERVIVAQTQDCGGDAPVLSDAAPAAGGTERFMDAITQGSALAFDPVELTGDDGLFLQYTGGTTGLSKGASLSHRNMVANIEQFKAMMPEAVRPGEEVVVTALPLYHIFALMMNLLSYFSVGAVNYLIRDPRDMDSFVAQIKTARFSVFTGVNTLFNGLVMHPGFKEVDFSNYRMSVGGGSAILPTTSDKWRTFTGQPIKEGYGLSEASPLVTVNPMSEKSFTATVGLPIPGTEIKLLRDDGSEAPRGEPGELCVRGPQVMSGYWRQPDANAEAFTADGYLRTGDIAELDEAGRVKIVDRKKDMILVSGFNVFPNEVEAVAAAHPGVAECACCGVPDERTGEAVRLFVVRVEGSTLEADEIIAHCRAQLTAYKVPKQIEFVASLPKSTVGKILRRELRKQ
jgi:long-chain acyl-CoA synthetase